MTSRSSLDLNTSINVSTQTIGETIHQFVDLPGLPSIQERIIHTQDDHVKKALTDLGWVCPQEAKAMEMRYSRLGNENLQLRADLNKMTDERNAWRTGHTDRTHEADKMRGELEAMRSELESTRKGWKELAEAPHKHQGMMVSLRGFVLRVSEYLDRKDQGGDAFVLREIQRNLCKVWNRRGDPRIVAEFGALYCLDKDGPIEEVEDDDDEEGGEV